MFNRNNIPNPFGGNRQDPGRNSQGNEQSRGGYGNPGNPPPRYDSPYDGQYGQQSGRGGPPPQQRRDQYGGPSDHPPQQGYGGAPQQGHGGPQRLPVNRNTPSGGSPRVVLRPIKSPAEQFTLRNLVAVSPYDFPPSRDGQDLYLLINDRFVFTARPADSCAQGTIGLSDPQRTWAAISLTDDMVNATIYDPFAQTKQAYLSSLDLEIGFAGKKISAEKYDQDELADIFLKTYPNQILTPGQRIIMDVRNIKLLVLVKTVQLTDLSMQKGDTNAVPLSDPSSRGILTPQTLITFYKNANTPIQLSGSTKKPAANSILAPDFKFEDMGIGGLDTEFSAIFRRAFASRIFPVGLVEKLGIQHVKGMLLYGPPGTGKTLIARQIGKMLNAKEPKVVNGPEILNAYVGKSEENVRKLFEDAEKEYKAKGDESALHIIIFDELDAVCKQRGSGNTGGTGVGDSIVNQLLAKLDGVEQLNNVFLIGMTNRKDMIDEALLRPGRLEVHMEISLPDEHGRLQILNIHTSRMKSNGVLDPDVDIAELAAATKNFSGAEISGLVKSASSFAFNRHIKVGTVAAVTDDIADMKVNRSDFLNALQEVRPAFGVSEAEIGQLIRGSIIRYSPSIESILAQGRDFVGQVRNSASQPLLSVLLHGAPGSGKTALAAQIALNSEFPLIKLISPESMIGFNEMSKINHINKVFLDAYKSPTSCVLIDNIERIIDWVPIGPRFLPAVMNVLATLVKKQPPDGHRLVVLATTSRRSTLSQLELLDCFDEEIPIVNVSTHQELAYIMRESQAFSDQDITRCLQELRERTRMERVGVGIKRILLGIETAKQDTDVAARFAEVMSGAIARGYERPEGGGERF